MDWTFLVLVAVLWLVSPIILLVALIVTHRRLNEARQRLTTWRPVESLPPGTGFDPSPPVLGGHHRHAPVDLENLLLLRLELQRLVDTGTLARERYRQLTDELDRLGARHLREGGARPESGEWQRRRTLAWNLLAQAMAMPPGPPPWQLPVLEPSEAPAALTPSPSPAGGRGEPSTPPPLGWTTGLHPPPEPPPKFQPPPPISPPPPPPIPAFRRQPVAPLAPPAPEIDADWRPAAPGALEKTLRLLSGWPKLIAPFLAQNIGWFIGGFCFVAGALFLIANTSGFVNALVVFASLFGATAFLLWAGYQFRRKGAELVVASSMLLTLAMLLAPLDLAVAVRLIDASGGDGALLIVSLLLTVLTLAGFGWAAALSSTLVDRTLRGRYPGLLTVLAAVQLAAPLAVVAPGWPGLAALHAVLLSLLAYGLWTFTREWLRRLFVDQRLTTYYAAGMLVYTATVSFVHLTWVWPEPLPAGYAGPFVMALCGLLFPVDAAFKDWMNKYAFLSRFSFALYGLSVVAVAVASQATPAALLTLAMGAVLYAWVTWRYRTWPPLYLLFGCVAGLYGFGVLKILPPAWHELASLPGLVALLALGHWAGSHSRTLALQCLLAGGGLLIGLTGWSLFWAAPGGLGGATAATAAMLLYSAVRLALALPDADPRWAYADAGVVVLATAAVAHAPAWLPLSWEMRTAFGLLALAALWTGLGLHDRRPSSASRVVWVSGALASVALALGGMVFWPALLGRLEPILLLALAGALLMWLSLGLRQRALFYGVLAVAAGIGVLVKHGYFPGPSTGLVEFLVVLALWSWLNGSAWRARSRRALLAGVEDVEPDVPTLTSLVRAPLEQAMALLWAVGLVHLGLRLLDGAAAARWPVVAGWAVLTGLLLIGHFHRFRWVALPFLLGLAGLLVPLDRMGLTLPWLGAAAVLYALLVWRASVVALASPLTWRLARLLGFTVPGGGDGRRQMEESLHGCALLVGVGPVAAGSALALLGAPTPELLPALALGLALFVLTGWHYRSAPHAGAALVTLTVGIWLLAAWLAPTVPFGWGQPLLNAVLSLVMALAALGLESARAAPLAYWRKPLHGMSGLLYALALAGTLLAALVADPRLPGLLVVLCIALFPVARPLPNAAEWRGLMLALLLGGLAWSLVARFGWSLRDAAWGAIVWGYALWLGGNLGLPRWNVRWPDWAAAPALWPLLGLAGVLVGVTVGFVAGALSPAAALAVLAPYLWLLLRNTAWPGLAWLAVAALAGSGVLAADILKWQPLAMALMLLWLNLLFLLGTVWRRHGAVLARGLGWRSSALASPLFWIPFALLALLTSVLALEVGGLWLTAAPRVEDGGMLAGVTLLLALTAGHAFKLRSERLPAHLLLLASTLLVGTVLLALAVSPGRLPLAVALWSGVLLLAGRYEPRDSDIWREALNLWLHLLPAVAVALLFALPSVGGGTVTLTLLALAGVALVRGWGWGESIWLKIGLVLALAAGYAVWRVGAASFAPAALIGLAPWYAVQTVLLWLAFGVLQRWLDARVGGLAARPEADQERLARLCDLEQALEELRPWLLGLGLLWLGGHGWAVLAYRAGWGPSPWHFGVSVDPLAAGAALLLLVGWAVVRAWRRPDESNRIYAAALLLGLLAGYGRLVALGLAPFTVGDTAALLAAAYAAFLLHQVTGLRPFYRLALLLPLLAVATVPPQLASAWSGGTLLAAAVLYLSLATRLRNPWPLYLGVLALNGAVYLWAPLWAERYGLWQFYIVPAAVSVLVLLHLHRRELRPKVLSGARLAALSALYAGAGLDVFLRPELGVFVLALALALTGIVAGIALRIRAFLYAGVAFLVFDVIGQLVRFYPEQGLSRALILIGLGAAITAGMVVFNLKREAILRRVRIVRADLAEWE